MILTWSSLHLGFKETLTLYCISETRLQLFEETHFPILSCLAFILRVVVPHYIFDSSFYVLGNTRETNKTYAIFVFFLYGRWEGLDRWKWVVIDVGVILDTSATHSENLFSSFLGWRLREQECGNPTLTAVVPAIAGDGRISIPGPAQPTQRAGKPCM